MDWVAAASVIGTVLFVLFMLVITVVVTVVSVAVPIGISVFIFKEIAKGAAAERALLQTGTPAVATITSIAQTGMFVNNNPQVQIVLEVAPSEGEPYTVHLNKVLQMVQIVQVQPGKVVDVRVDPANPKRIAIVGL